MVYYGTEYSLVINLWVRAIAMRIGIGMIKAMRYKLRMLVAQ